MSRELATRQVTIGDYVLSVTTRYVKGDQPQWLEELTFRTIGAWLYIAGVIEKQLEGTSDVLSSLVGSVESRFAQEKNIELQESFIDSRVSVWDTYRGNKQVNFHLNSDDDLMIALDMWKANNFAIDRALKSHAPKATETAPASAPTRESAPAPVVTPEAPKQSLTDGIAKVNGKKAAKELTPNTPFLMPIAKISAVMSPEGLLKWELFGFYGSNPGKFSDLVIFSDNENSIRNGLNAALTAIVNKPGQSVTGKWLARGKVIEKEGKKLIFTNLLFTEGGELLNQKPQKEKSDKFDERDYYAGAYADDWNEFEDTPS